VDSNRELFSARRSDKKIKRGLDKVPGFGPAIKHGVRELAGVGGKLEVHTPLAVRQASNFGYNPWLLTCISFWQQPFMLGSDTSWL